jgi:membrane protease subunit HflK
MNTPNNDMQKEFENFVRNLKNNFKSFLPIIAIVFVVLFGTTSFYTVEPDEEAVVIRFGKYLDTQPPGPHFKLPFGIDNIFKVQTTRVLQEEFGFRTSDTRPKRTVYSDTNYNKESLMLTGDLNVADVEWVVQYKISDPFKFLFQTRSPIINIRDVSESIMRRVVGDRTVNEVLTTGRKEISLRAKELTQEVLDKYNLGVSIITVKLQDVNPPEKVKSSFNEVNEAKQEQEKVINQAEKAYNNIIPEAKGQAEKVLAEAQAYSMALVNRAEGDAAKFLSILKEYKRAPAITQKRMYIETMEELFSKLENITIVDAKIKGLMPIYSKAISTQTEK